MTARPVPAELLDSWRDRFECWNRHEFDEMAQMYREDGVYDASAVFIGESPIRGREAMLAYWEQMWEIWDGARWRTVHLFDKARGNHESHRYRGDKKLLAESTTARGVRRGDSSGAVLLSGERERIIEKWRHDQ